MRRTLVNLFVIFVSLFSSFVYGQAQAAPPNLVHLLIDNQGWKDLGCQGSTYYHTLYTDDSTALLDAMTCCCLP